MPVGDPAAPLPAQLSAAVPGKPEEAGLSAWTLHHTAEHEEAPAFCFQTSSVLTIVDMCGAN